MPAETEFIGVFSRSKAISEPPWLVFCFSMGPMQIEIFALCHSARFDGANLSLIGIFDTLGAKTFPTQISCTVLAKIRFELGEEGERKLEIVLVNAYMRP